MKQTLKDLLSYALFLLIIFDTLIAGVIATVFCIDYAHLRNVGIATVLLVITVSALPWLVIGFSKSRDL